MASYTTKADDGTWTFQCPGVEGSPCGEIGGQPFFSSGWPSKKIADARGQQHFDAHRGHPTPDLDDFRAEHGLIAASNGIHAVRIEDLP
jgi:hypothetical protein